jgi:hypothetical protein
VNILKIKDWARKHTHVEMKKEEVAKTEAEM